MPLDPRTRRLLIGAHALGKQRAEVKAREHLENLAELFERANSVTQSEIRALRDELAERHLVDAAMVERAEHGPWLH
jgi:hypothetical protein